MEKKQIFMQERARIYTSMVTEAIQAANKAVEDTNARDSRADSIEALNNAASAYNQITRSNYMTAEMALWIDTLAYNLPSCIIDYIKGVYGDNKIYKTGEI